MSDELPLAEMHQRLATAARWLEHARRKSDGHDIEGSLVALTAALGQINPVRTALGMEEDRP